MEKNLPINESMNEATLRQIIKEEAVRFTKKLALQAEKNKLMESLKQLEEEERKKDLQECGMGENEMQAEMEEGLGDVMKQAGQKFGEFMGSKWTPEKAEQAYNQSYAKSIQTLAQQLGTTPDLLKPALINFMVQNGGLAVLGGNGQNAIWNANTKQIIRKSGGYGGGANPSPFAG